MVVTDKYHWIACVIVNFYFHFQPTVGYYIETPEFIQFAAGLYWELPTHIEIAAGECHVGLSTLAIDFTLQIYYLDISLSSIFFQVISGRLYYNSSQSPSIDYLTEISGECDLLSPLHSKCMSTAGQDCNNSSSSSSLTSAGQDRGNPSSLTTAGQDGSKSSSSTF